MKDTALAIQTQEENTPDSEGRLDSGYQDDKAGHGDKGSRSSLDDFNNVEGREILTPSLPKADTMDDTRYTPPPNDPEENSPRRLPPVTISNQQKMSHYPTEDDHQNETTINMAALPPISGVGNKVVPASEEFVQRSQLRQRSAGNCGNSRGRQSPLVWKGPMESKEDIIYGGKLKTFF